MPSKLKKAIAAVKDQTSIRLAKVAGKDSSNLEVAVLKATTHDDVPVDEKYVYEVVQLVSSNKSYAASCARAIGKRIGRTRNWVVALKSLTLVLHIFQDGDPYFPREVLHAMKRGAKILNLSTFRDDSNSNPWDFTAFVRTFALYLDERLDCFLTGKLQRRYTQRLSIDSSHHHSKRHNDPIREMKPAVLIDRIIYWQRLLERAIATWPTGAARSNRLVIISLCAVIQESFDLYKDISDGLTILIDSFFHLQYQNCVSALQTCVRATKQFEDLNDFYSLCKSIGVGRTNEYPSVQTISEELIETLRDFLKDQSSANDQSPNPDMSKSPNNTSPCNDRAKSVHVTKQDGSTKQIIECDSQPRSLEDLITATETDKTKGPSISIDLEAYSDQFDKQMQSDEPFWISDTGSCRSLPVSNSMLDLMSLGDWANIEEKESNIEQETKDQKPKELETCPTKSWEIVLAETISVSPEHSVHVAGNFNAFPDQVQSQRLENNGLVDNSRIGWDVVLFEPEPQTTQPVQNVNDTLYSQTTLSSPEHYNPFLQDMVELPTVSNVEAAPTSSSADMHVNFEAFPTISAEMHGNFDGAHTFPSPPTFRAGLTLPMQNTCNAENDPFASVSTSFLGEHTLNSSESQQNLQQEQQVWLQNQNQIIAKHLV